MTSKEELTIYHIAGLIRSRLRGEITPEDSRRLEAWLAETPANRRLLEQLSDMDWRNAEVEKMLQYAPDGKWQRVLGKARRRKTLHLLRRYSAVAAVAVFCIGMAVLLQRETPVEPAEIAVHHRPVMAKLTTGAGNTVVLDSSVTEIHRHISLRNGNEIVFSPVDTPASKQLPQPKYNTLEIMRGGEYRIVLADGTTVFLNSQTVLKFPDDFTTATARRVYLSGEALFKVAKDENKPFIVECGDYEVKVLGTVFNVSNYPDDPFSHTTLKEGKVEVSRKDEKVILQPGFQARVQEGVLSVQKVDIENYVTWMDENFRFKSENIDRILKRLARWYDFEVFYLNPEVKEYHFTGYLPRYGKVSNVLELLANTTDIHFEVKGKTVLVGKK